MLQNEWRKLVAIDMSLYAGMPTVSELGDISLPHEKIPIAWILGDLARGLSYDDLKTKYRLQSDSPICAAIAYAAELATKPMAYDLWDQNIGSAIVTASDLPKGCVLK